MTRAEMVAEFHQASGAPVLSTPTVPDSERLELRARLIAEEAGEVCAALWGLPHVAKLFVVALEQATAGLPVDPQRVEIAEVSQELADLAYVTEGAALEVGVDLGPVFDAVHAANMGKRCGECGAMHRDARGKTVKPEGFVSAAERVRAEVARQTEAAR